MNTIVDQMLDDVNVANRAVKVIFHRGTGATKRVRDKGAEELIRNTLGSEDHIVTRRLFRDKQSLIYKRQQQANVMYAYHMEHTLPYGDDAERMMPNSMILTYTMEMGELDRKVKVMDDEIRRTYPQLVLDDVIRRNMELTSQGKTAIACEADYPSLELMESYLYVTWRIEPISTAGDFRFAVDDSIKERMVEHAKVVEQTATQELYATMLAPMKHFVDKLSVPIGEQGSIFRDSLVTNVNETLGMVKALNVYGNAHIDSLVSEIEQVVKPYVFAPSVLREQPESRSAAREKMAELMKKLDGYI